MLGFPAIKIKIIPILLQCTLAILKLLLNDLLFIIDDFCILLLSLANKAFTELNLLKLNN